MQRIHMNSQSGHKMSETKTILDPCNASIDVPATFVNRFQMMLGADGQNLRIGFGEAVPGKEVYHLAVVLSANDAKGFAEAILKALIKPPPEEEHSATGT